MGICEWGGAGGGIYFLLPVPPVSNPGTSFTQVEEEHTARNQPLFFVLREDRSIEQAQLHTMNFVTEQGEKNLHQVILELRALVVVDR